MTLPALLDALKTYARRVRAARRANPGVTEPGLAPEFQRLVEALLPLLPAAPQLTVSPEFTNPGVGRPDIALKRPGEAARAFVELKALDKSTDGAGWKPGHDRRQFERFKELPNWAISNFHEVRLYARREEQGAASIVPLAALDPESSDAAADKLIDAHDPAPALRLIERLAQAGTPHAKDAAELAQHLAHSARLVKAIVVDRLAELTAAKVEGAALQQVRKDFRDVLYSHPEAAGYASADFDDLFAGAFAQTLAFGLLLVREATGGAPVDAHAYEHMPPEHPLMRTTLRVLSQTEVAREVGAGFEVMLDTVNGFDLAILAAEENGRDPILHFYEEFLATFDPAARERYGVYYTPIEVVRFMVGALDRALKARLGTEGLADDAVHILDPATGTGTFLIGVAERVRAEAARSGSRFARLALESLARRMYGFELLVGPYAVAHYRLHHALRGEEPAGAGANAAQRLGVYLTDTLAEPGTAAPLGALGFLSEGIQDERRDADRVKTEQPILAILGNPPYRRLERGEDETLVGRWMNGLWDDLKAPVRDAGWGNQLNTFPELSVAFWRWALWKMLEAPNAPRRGVVAFITNRKFLTGKPYAGLRRRLRERFDRIEVIDLRGDSRVGERAGVERDGNVFNIQVGVAITLAVADGSRAEGELAKVTYADAWEQAKVSRRDKLRWMEEGAEAGAVAGGEAVERGALEDMRPRPFFNGELLSIAECFELASSGIETTRDHLAYGLSESDLKSKLDEFWKLPASSAEERYSSTRKAEFSQAFSAKWNPKAVVQSSYRPLDRRALYNERGFVDWPRPKLQQAWGSANIALFAMPNGTASGPGLWCQGDFPDRHAFRGSYGGYAFPLYDRRPGHGPYNLKPALVTALAAAYGPQVTPEQVFDAVLGLLSAASYTTRFAEDLEDAFPHAPFPSDPALFAEAAALGAEIRAVQTFARKPAARFVDGVALYETDATGPLAAQDWKDGSLALCADGSGRLDKVPKAVWEFSVSGYRLLFRWLDARRGLPVDKALVEEVRDLVGRIGELVDLFARADTVLARTLDSPLSRGALGLEEAE